MSAAVQLAETTPKTPAAPPKKPGRGKQIGAIAGAVLVVVAGGWWFVHRNLESTDDAQTDSDVVAIPARVGGVVTKVLFEDNQQVKKGDVLAELDTAPLTARLAQAEAALEQAKAAAEGAEADARVAEAGARGGFSGARAALKSASASAVASGAQIAEGRARVAQAEAAAKQAESDLVRARELRQQNVIPQQALERAETQKLSADAALSQARASLAALEASAQQAASRVGEANARLTQTSQVDAAIAQARARARGAQAQVQAAQATRDLAALDLSWARIVAPQDGVVSKRAISVGAQVQAGQPIAQLVPAKLWVSANFKETQMDRVRPGQKAEVEIDAFSGVKLHGHVESISGATGAKFALLPPDNATGNFTKVVQRVPVRIALDELPAGLPLRPGLSVYVDVDTKSAP